MNKKNKVAKVLIILLVILAVLYLILNFALYSFGKSLVDEVPVDYGTYEHYDAGTLDDYKVITCEGLSLKAPAMMEQMVSDDNTEEEGEQVL